MSDVRSPGSQGVSRGKSESQKNHEPLSGSNSNNSVGGSTRPAPIVAPATKGKKGNPVR